MISPWGEHEIDYVLFITIPSRSCITLTPHPEEVDDVKWVTQSELLDMFQDESLLFSPWFRIIANRWLVGNNNKICDEVGDDEKSSRGGGDGGGWWDDLKRTMTTNDYCDYGTIHRFDPPIEHMGGDGDAGPWLTSSTYEDDILSSGEEKKSEDYSANGVSGVRKEFTLDDGVIGAMAVGDSS